jgi:hypothetical protein
MDYPWSFVYKFKTDVPKLSIPPKCSYSITQKILNQQKESEKQYLDKIWNSLSMEQKHYFYEN